jgi:flagellin FlaA/flagellin FlaB
MVLVAAIAAGVLINTAGFLQSSAEQTGQESSAQVTNQIQVASKVGTVAGGSSSDTVRFESPSGSVIAIDSGSTVQIKVTANSLSSNSVLTAGPNGGSSGNLGIDADDTLQFTKVSDSTVEIQNQDTGASIEIDTDKGQSLKLIRSGASTSISSAADIQFVRTYDDPNQGEISLLTATITEVAESGGASPNDANTLGITAGTNGEQYVPLDDGDSDDDNIVISDGTVVEVGSDTASGAQIGGSNKIPISTGDTLLFEFVSDSEIRITNQDTGASVNVGAFTGGATDDIQTNSNTIDLIGPDGTELEVSGGSPFVGLTSSDVDAGVSNNFLLVNEKYQIGGGGVSELNIVAIKGSGADQINMEQTTITTIGPDGSNTLTYSADGATEDQTYAVEAIQDDDDSLPVMTDSDRFRIVINPGTLETGETMTLEVTTESGATTEVRVSVPNTLAGESAVQV